MRRFKFIGATKDYCGDFNYNTVYDINYVGLNAINNKINVLSLFNSFPEDWEEVFENESPWISVKDRLPDFGSQVISIIPKNFDGSNQDGFYLPFSCDFDDEFGFCDLDNVYKDEDNTCYKYNDRVSHWMPLPEPPK